MSGKPEDDLDALLAAARANPDDVQAVLAAGGACDRIGREHDAIGYYERARELGIPEELKQDFTIWYGSTLRNVGRLEESVTRLAEGCALYPENATMRAFLALALHSSGHHSLAMASMLEAALAAAARPDGFGRYARALTSYQAELVTESIGPEPLGD
jgi:tetratricopeptide (TPR) repeat protein